MREIIGIAFPTSGNNPILQVWKDIHMRGIPLNIIPLARDAKIIFGIANSKTIQKSHEDDIIIPIKENTIIALHSAHGINGDEYYIKLDLIEPKVNNVPCYDLSTSARIVLKILPNKEFIPKNLAEVGNRFIYVIPKVIMNTVGPNYNIIIPRLHRN